MNTLNLYQRYKIGTKYVVQWLVDTDQSLERLRLDSPAKNSRGVETKRDEVVISELRGLAKSVVRGAEASSLPLKGLQDVLIALRDVISGRNECAAWYKTNEYASQTSSDQPIESVSSQEQQASHSHFVRVLSDVLQCLEKGAGGLWQASRAPRHDSPQARVENIYTCLFLEEPSTEPVGTFISSASVKKTKAKKKPKLVDVQLSLEEEDFALWCFLKDWRKVRVFLRNAWRGYHNGEIGIITVSRLTNNAMLLLQRSSREFACLHPQLGDFKLITDRMQVRLATRGSEVETFTSANTSFPEKEKTDTSSSQAFDLLCIPALHLLNLFQLSNSSLDAGDPNYVELLSASAQLIGPEVLYLQPSRT